MDVKASGQAFGVPDRMNHEEVNLELSRHMRVCTHDMGKPVCSRNTRKPEFQKQLDRGSHRPARCRASAIKCTWIKVGASEGHHRRAIPVLKVQLADCSNHRRW